MEKRRKFNVQLNLIHIVTEEIFVRCAVFGPFKESRFSFFPFLPLESALSWALASFTPKMGRFISPLWWKFINYCILHAWLSYWFALFFSFATDHHTISSTVLWNEETNIFSQQIATTKEFTVRITANCLLCLNLLRPAHSATSYMFMCSVEKLQIRFPIPTTDGDVASFALIAIIIGRRLLRRLPMRATACARESICLSARHSKYLLQNPDVKATLQSSTRFRFQSTFLFFLLHKNPMLLQQPDPTSSSSSSCHAATLKQALRFPHQPSIGIGRSSWARQEKKSSQRSCIVRSVEYMRQQRWRHNIFKRNSDSRAVFLFLHYQTCKHKSLGWL